MAKLCNSVLLFMHLCISWAVRPELVGLTHVSVICVRYVCTFANPGWTVSYIWTWAVNWARRASANFLPFHTPSGSPCSQDGGQGPKLRKQVCANTFLTFCFFLLCFKSHGQFQSHVRGSTQGHEHKEVREFRAINVKILPLT